MFNHKSICRYSHPHEVVFDNGYEFKIKFITFLKYLYIKPVCTAVNNLQDNSRQERVYQVACNFIFTKDIDFIIFDYIDTWGENLEPIAWAIMAYYLQTIVYTPCESIFDIDMILNLT